MHRTRTAAATALAMALAVLPLTGMSGPPGTGDDRAPDGARDRPVAAAAPSLSPTPRSVQRRSDRVTLTPSVTVVAGPKADAAAVSVVESALADAGAQHVVRAGRAPGDGQLTVYVDGAGAARALAELGARGPDGLPAEGYALAVGEGRIALSGKDATGTYYAAQTLRQLLPHRARPGARVAGTLVRDWPATPLRGVIEGFYGTPWSHEARLDQLDFYGAHKMNLYVYSPKDDAYLREKWRDPYPAERLAQLKELVDRARQRHVEFTYALSPGLSVCYSSDADLRALTAKFRTLWDIGVRTFAVPLDDISYTDWNCAADKDRFGTGGGAAGAAQAYLLNRVQREFIAAHPGAAPLQMVPTEYSDVQSSPYKKALATQLDPKVLVEWTGVGVIAPTMTVRQAQQAREVFGHPILTWDNYPVNDYVTNRLLLGPFHGREKGLPEQLAGITANPMIQPAASKLALYTVADYAWNDTAYDARASWGAAIEELAGGDARTARALRAFADTGYSSALNPQQAPELAAAIAEFTAGGPAGRLDAVLRTLEDAPAVLRDRLPDRGFVRDSAPWLDATHAWGVAARTALRLIGATKAGDGAQAWELRQQIPELVRAARSFVYVDMRGKKVPVLVADGVLDTFVEDAVAAHDRALGVNGRPRASTDLSVYQDNAPSRMTDGEDATYFWSGAAPRAGSVVGLDLRAERPLGPVTLSMGKSDSPDDYLHHGVLEYSSDHTNWRQLAAFDGKAEVTAVPPAGATARYVRARATRAQDNWLVVREFTVSGAEQATVAGGPPAAGGSALRSAGDGDPATVYRAARAPRSGEALEFTPSAPRTARSVVVLRPHGATGPAARIEVRTGGVWRTLGTLSGAYTRLAAGGGAIEAVRLAWRDPSAVPEVNEVILH
ncbi:beta-N-acetylglucosaminidase domain-containing protein [Streptomyces sioyaensis]|uniref:Beta-N-acetylhexosaminidase n=1 Tax=Streptomyces sioyaensis TaxID=67364 RepID=A0A4Q1R5H6_9ACTN|nr:beta-N-acetylglucosaminidase domain-containing protein [Streptomyces sioyaensis]MBM4792708.1 beta-N-acetylglucosaminidase domain-containing protein [Streptomyces sioyaensis]RXS67923.1 beta-N-acetylhexosaminidase [Streptomyces sioyaensis]